MKRIFSPLFLFLFVVFPQLASLAYLSLASGMDLKPLLLLTATALACAVLVGIYAYRTRKEAVTGTKILIAISLVYTFFAAWGVLFDGGSLFGENFISPRLVFIEACMLSVLYSILGVAHHTTPPGKAYPTAKYVAGIITVPFLWYLGINLLRGVNSETVLLMLIIASTYGVLFFSAKMLFVWQGKQQAAFSLDTPFDKKYYRAAFIVSFCLPLGGLALNQSFAGWGGASSAGLFGDFSHPLFYIIAALNGLLLLIPSVENKGLRLALFYLKSVGCTFILYFFAVFFPILPLGVVGIVFYGLGIFALTPALATLLQGYHMVKEGMALAKSFNKWRLTAVFCLGLITLPLCLAAAFQGDKGNFALAAQYLTQDDLQSTAPVSLSRLDRTLKNMNGSLQFTRGRFGFSPGSTPILSAFYSNFVLEGKVISRDNILALENLFFDAGHNLGEEKLSDTDVNDNRVKLLSAAGETKFDAKEGVYRSWVHLQLKNTSLEENGEYVTSFRIPEGAYVSDYYLNVAGTKKEGILADRRAALFIYRKIVNTRKDPGLLHYTGRNTLELRVFPFAPNEVRETGFEIIHSQKLDVTLDSQTVSLEGDAAQEEIKVPGAVLLSADGKASLDSVVRAPKYYFVVDSSKNSDVAWHISQIQAYAQAHDITEGEVIFASYRLQKYALADITRAEYQAECGFNLNGAVRTILEKEGPDTFPVIIAVSDNMPGAVFPQNIRPLVKKFPESDYYYALNHYLTLTPYSYENNRAGTTVDEPVIAPVLNYHGVYVSDNRQNELVLTDTQAGQFASTGNRYQDAVLLDALEQKMLWADSSNSVELVRASFRTRILTPQTAFMVVETPEQEKDLLELQERILNNNETPPVTLDEPSFITCLLLFMLVLLIKKCRFFYKL